MKHNLRITIANKENQLQEIWEIRQVCSRSRIFATIIERLATFENGHLRIEILKERR